MDYFESGTVRQAGTISLTKRHQIIEEYLETDQGKVDSWQKYASQQN